MWGGHYEPGSLIWRSRWVTGDGIIESREALVFPGEADRLVLLRQVRAPGPAGPGAGVLDPRADFGRAAGPRRQPRRRWSGPHRRLYLRFRWSAHGCAGTGRVLAGELTVPAGGRHDLVLEISRSSAGAAVPRRPGSCGGHRARLGPVVPSLAGPARRDATLAYAVLRGMTAGRRHGRRRHHRAARAGDGGRNYDYRYAWIRDQCFAGQAAALAGRYDLLDEAVAFLTDRVLADGDRLAPAYTVDGDPVPDERAPGPARLPGWHGDASATGCAPVPARRATARC